MGRLASRIAVLLQASLQHRHVCPSRGTHLSSWWLPVQGKDKPDYVPYLDKGDIVVVKNARHVEFTGKKWDQKLYRHHTG